MGVEADARTAHGPGEEQLAAGGQDALQLQGGLARAERVERIAVAAKRDVLGHVQARQGLN